ncbi:MAG: hypothetical protein ACYS26_00710 [Planctomycetota bacterium]|jgi:hypothetical protein
MELHPELASWCRRQGLPREVGLRLQPLFMQALAAEGREREALLDALGDRLLEERRRRTGKTAGVQLDDEVALLRMAQVLHDWEPGSPLPGSGPDGLA